MFWGSLRGAISIRKVVGPPVTPFRPNSEIGGSISCPLRTPCFRGSVGEELLRTLWSGFLSVKVVSRFSRDSVQGIR